jgi:hypothetical protein
MKMPETYWEERVVVLEGLVELLMHTLMQYQPGMAVSIKDLHTKWGQIVDEMDVEYTDKK